MHQTEQPLVDKDYLLEKFSGKGGWTFAAIPEIPSAKNTHFGWVRVKGNIDGYYISQYHLMPMGNNQLFLPIKASIRKAIGKKAGDTVRITLYKDDSLLVIPDDLLDCLKDEPQAFKNFQNYSEGEKKLFIDWINAGKTRATKENRMAVTVNAVMQSLKFSAIKMVKTH